MEPCNQSGVPFPGATGYPPPQGYYGPPQAGYPPPQGNTCYPGAPITNQPMGQVGAPGSWMCKPPTVTNCPPGLEYLNMIDQLLVYQTKDVLEIVSAVGCNNQYYVTNSLGQKVYYAREYSNNCAKRFGVRRPFEMKIFDNFGQEIINLNRPLACQWCCCPCCLQSMDVDVPAGTSAGTIEQQWSILYPAFAIKNSTGDTVLQIKGPCCTSNCCSDTNFNILSADGDMEVGKISKKWSGFGKHSHTDTDSFGISFPMDLDVRMKAVMLGACFLIDMMYFESTPNK